ncbi:MAG: hypothetical protein HZB92_05715 [Euryarchaeota archaeon]|nr:hypothetical protein [Euryarchaeota archaeon]
MSFLQPRADALVQPEESGALTKRKALTILLPLIAMIIWCISLIDARGNYIGDYGLFSVLPISYYAAFFLLLGSIYYTSTIKLEGGRRFYTLVLAFQSALLMVFIFVTPALLEMTARSAHSWIKYGYADYIVRNSHITQAIWYHNWPLPFIFTAQFVQVTSMGPIYTPLLLPLIIDVMIFLMVLLIFTKLFTDMKKRFIGLAFFYLLAWQDQFYYIPQIFAFLIFLLLVYLIHTYLVQFKVKMITTILLLFAALMLTHLLTAIVIGLHFGLVFLSELVLKKEKLRLKQAKIKYLILVALLVVIALGWYFFAGDWIRRTIGAMDISSFLILVPEYLSKLTMGSEAHGDLVLIRMAFSVIVAFIALSGAYIAFEKKHRKSMILLLAAGITPIFLFVYGVEIVQRAYLFCSLPLAVLVAIGLDRKKFFAFIIAFSLFAVPLHILATYGNEKVDYISPSEIAGAEFVFNHIQRGNIIEGGSSDQGQYVENFFRNNLKYWQKNRDTMNESYLIYSSSSSNFETWYSGDSAYEQSIQRVINNFKPDKIYSTKGYEIYKL